MSGSSSIAATERSSELLPCPFCGTRAEFLNRRGDRFKPPKWAIICDNERCGMFVPEDDESKEDVSAAWNRRSVNALSDLVAALEYIASVARFEQDTPTEMRDTAFALIEKTARTVLAKAKGE